MTLPRTTIKTTKRAGVPKKVRTPKAAAVPPVLSGRFAALDFETADYGRDSACALSVVIVEQGKIVET